MERGRQSNLIVAEWIVTACCTALRLINYICIYIFFIYHCITVFLHMDLFNCCICNYSCWTAAVINCFCYKSFLPTNCPNLPIVRPESRGHRSEGNTNTQFNEIQMLNLMKYVQTLNSTKYKHSIQRNINTQFNGIQTLNLMKYVQTFNLSIYKNPD